MEIDVVASDRAELGESPVWSQREGALYWIDWRARRIFRLDVGSGARASWETPSAVSAVALRRSGGLLVAMKSGLALLDTTTGIFETIADPETHIPDSSFNDGKVDSAGRFWVGSVQERFRTATGRIYRFDPDGTLAICDESYTIPNGPAWSPDDRRMYLADSASGTIFCYDYDAASGDIRNRREFARMDAGMPDGATVDVDGYLWSANVDNWSIIRYAPDGSVDRVLELPLRRPTSVTFGGDDLRTLFITTATSGLSPEELVAQPLAGAVISVRVDVEGLPDHEFGG